MVENPLGEKLLCTTVLRSLVQKTSSNTTGIATHNGFQMLEIVIILICQPSISWLESNSAPLREDKMF